MAALVNGNIILIFFFAMLAIYNYINLKEYQRITIIYISIYGMVVINAVSIKVGLVMLGVSLFCFFEILTTDEMKFKIIVKPVNKIIDCIYISIAQYAVICEIISIVLCYFYKKYRQEYEWVSIIYACLSFVILVVAVTTVLQQKYVVKSFDDMCRVFREFPINRVVFNDKLYQACKILVSIEDRRYYDRKGYTDFNLKTVKETIDSNIDGERIQAAIIRIVKWIMSALSTAKRVWRNFYCRDRGYSTIPMQLVRSLGLDKGYNCQIRRKIYECLYSKLFFDGLREYFEQNYYSGRSNFKEYLLYIYFHSVTTYLGEAEFSKFLNAFDMQYSERNKKDIYDCTNEGIFIACMGLSKRATIINQENVSYFTSMIDGMEFDEGKICQMVLVMMDKPYDGNYLV